MLFCAPFWTFRIVWSGFSRTRLFCRFVLSVGSTLQPALFEGGAPCHLCLLHPRAVPPRPTPHPLPPLFLVWGQPLPSTALAELLGRLHLGAPALGLAVALFPLPPLPLLARVGVHHECPPPHPLRGSGRGPVGQLRHHPPRLPCRHPPHPPRPAAAVSSAAGAGRVRPPNWRPICPLSPLPRRVRGPYPHGGCPPPT